MPRESYASLQAKIEKEITKLQKKAEALQTKRRKPVIATIVASMREYNITPEEIAAAFGGGARAPRPAARPLRRPPSARWPRNTAIPRPARPGAAAARRRAG